MDEKIEQMDLKSNFHVEKVRTAKGKNTEKKEKKRNLTEMFAKQTVGSVDFREERRQNLKKSKKVKKVIEKHNDNRLYLLKH